MSLFFLCLGISGIPRIRGIPQVSDRGFGLRGKTSGKAGKFHVTCRGIPRVGDRGRNFEEFPEIGDVTLIIP
jgi:hypothetical protein